MPDTPPPAGPAPERCPVCDGLRRVDAHSRSARLPVEWVRCPRCHGTGIAPPDEEGKRLREAAE